jgi:hypothetical protein
VVVDQLTKHVFYIPTEGMSAIATAERIYAHVFQLCGFLDSIISDQGPAFTLVVRKHVCKYLKIQHCLSTTYNPEADSQSENANQQLQIHLGKYVSYF